MTLEEIVDICKDEQETRGFKPTQEPESDKVSEPMQGDDVVVDEPTQDDPDKAAEVRRTPYNWDNVDIAIAATKKE